MTVEKLNCAPFQTLQNFSLFFQRIMEIALTEANYAPKAFEEKFSLSGYSKLSSIRLKKLKERLTMFDQRVSPPG